jgi:hypothetical protein
MLGLLALPRSSEQTIRSAGPALLFLSPNTDEGLSLEESLRRMGTPVHENSRLLARDILQHLAAGHAEVHDALGDWEGGAENSLLVVLHQTRESQLLRCAVAWFGLLTRQKAVLAFRPHPWGRDVVATIDVPGYLPEIRAHLDRHGLRDRTILIDRTGCRVVVLDEGGRQQVALRQFARTLNGRLELQRGHSEAVVGATRDEARTRYREVLRNSRLAAKALEDADR